MKRQLAMALCMILVSGVIQPVAKECNQHIEKGEVIVKYKGECPNIKWPASVKLEKEWVFDDKENLPYTLAYFTSDNNSTKQLIQYFISKRGVEYVEPNAKLHAMALDLPNDPFVGRQWYMSTEVLDYERSSKVDIGIESLWAETDNTIEENVVAVIDTGVDYTHPDLAPHMWENKTSLPGKHGYNFLEQTDNPMDLVGHGTHCAGIIAAVANNDLGISGISRNTKIMALKYIDETGNGKIAQVIDAYAYILEAKKQGVNVVAVSNSWGGTTNPKALEDIIETAGQNGILSICASGNFGINLDEQKSFPASYASPYTIVVAASTPDDELASFSCYGKYTVDVTAPGTSMLSTYNTEGYLPGIANTDQLLLTFQDEKRGFQGKNISIIDTRSFSGTHALLWKLQASPAGEAYLEGEENIQYTNILELEVPASKRGSYFGMSFWAESPVLETGTTPFCYIDIYQDGKWRNVGRLNIESTNYWDTRWFSIGEDVTKIRLIGIGATDGSEVYLDQIGIGTSTGKYTYLEGTSVATSVVTAEIAMLTRIFPEETPAQIRGRVIGGVDRTMIGFVASDGRINVKKAIDNPYPVISTLTQNKEAQIVLTGEFFGDESGRVSLNGNGLDIVSWENDKITLKYTGNFDGYGNFKVTRKDGESSEQLLIVSNPQFNWRQDAALPVALKNAATATQDGMIYVMGGIYNEDKPMRSVYRYNITENKWDEVASLPEINHIESYASGGSATALDNHILLMTFDTIDNKNEFYLYSIKDNVWEKLNVKEEPEPREYASLVTYKDSIYMVGGLPRGEHNGKKEFSRGIWKLNKNQTAWEKVADLNEGRYAPIVAVAGNQMIITGGMTDHNVYATSTEIFNGKKLITGARLPFAGADSQNTVYGGGRNLYVMTDSISFDTPGFIYAPDTNTWSNSTYRLGYSKILGAASATSNDRLYAIGGEEDYRSVATVRSIEIEEAVHHKEYMLAFLVGVAVIVIIIIVILITIWIKKKKKPKKIYIR